MTTHWYVYFMGGLVSGPFNTKRDALLYLVGGSKSLLGLKPTGHKADKGHYVYQIPYEGMQDRFYDVVTESVAKKLKWPTTLLEL